MLMFQNYFTDTSGNKDWHGIWLAFAAYALVIAVLFVFIFKHKHDPLKVENDYPEPAMAA